MDAWIVEFICAVVLIFLLNCGLLLAWYKPFVFFTLFALELSISIGCLTAMTSRMDDGSQSTRPQLQRFLKDLRIGAHRGLAMDAPENTLFAIRLSKAMNADLVEIDVSLTADGIPVLMHDDTVDRTTNGSGRIDSMTLQEIASLDAAAKFRNGTLQKFEKVPTLEEALQLADDLQLRVIIDVKHYDSKMINAIIKLYQKYPHLLDSAAVSSFHPAVALAIKAADSRIVIGHTWCSGCLSQKSCSDRSPRFSNALVHCAAVVAENVYIRLLHDWIISFVDSFNFMRYVDDLKLRRLHVIAWTIDNVSQRDYYYNVLKCPFLTDTLVNFSSNTTHEAL